MKHTYGLSPRAHYHTPPPEASASEALLLLVVKLGAITADLASNNLNSIQRGREITHELQYGLA